MQFSSKDISERALSKHKSHMGHRWDLLGDNFIFYPIVSQCFKIKIIQLSRGDDIQIPTG